MVAPGQIRAHGETTAEEVTREVSEEADQPISIDLPGEDPRSRFRTPGFSRMRTTWSPEDRRIVEQAKAAVDDRIIHNFAGAYEVMNQVYDIVRTPQVDANGFPVRDQYGFVVWARRPDGGYDEDFTRLSHKDREHLLFLITTRLFEWSQVAADAWAEAMFSKSIWEERFSMGFEEPATGTVEARTAAGRLSAREERYFAIFTSHYSRRADAIVRTLELLGQRLKDAMTA